jgi:hypothetical protein
LEIKKIGKLKMMNKNNKLNPPFLMINEPFLMINEPFPKLPPNP